MIEASLSFLAWIGVIFIQAAVHVSIFGSRRKVELDGTGTTTSGGPSENDDDVRCPKHHTIRTDGGSDCVPPHMTEHPSEDELDDEEEMSFDGDEPKLFFDLLGQTGSEMVKVSDQRTGSIKIRNNLATVSLFLLQFLTEANFFMFCFFRVVHPSKISSKSRLLEWQRLEFLFDQCCLTSPQTLIQRR